jgi:hypothetical protein
MYNYQFFEKKSSIIIMNNKSCLFNAIIIYIISMYVLINLKPIGIYDHNNKIKSWESININNPVTLHNIYIYALLCAIFSHYVAREF